MVAVRGSMRADVTSQGCGPHYLDKPWCRMLVAGFQSMSSVSFAPTKHEHKQSTSDSVASIQPAFYGDSYD